MPNFDILVLWINSNDVVAGIVLMAFSVSVIVLLQDWFGTLGVFYLGCFFGWIFLGFSELREDALNGIWNEFGTHCPKSFSDLLFDEEYCIIQDPHCSLLSTLYLTGGGYIDMMDFLKIIQIWCILTEFLSPERKTPWEWLKHLNGAICSLRWQKIGMCYDL